MCLAFPSIPGLCPAPARRREAVDSCSSTHPVRYTFYLVASLLRCVAPSTANGPWVIPCAVRPRGPPDRKRPRRLADNYDCKSGFEEQEKKTKHHQERQTSCSSNWRRDTIRTLRRVLESCILRTPVSVCLCLVCLCRQNWIDLCGGVFRSQ